MNSVIPGLIVVGALVVLMASIINNDVESTFISVPPSGFASINVDELNIALGLVDGYRIVDKFGKSSDIDTTFEDIWNAGGTITILSSASTMIVDSSGVDTNGGVGANTLTIQGVNGTYHAIEETITLNEASSPTTTNSFIAINRAFVVASGTSLTNVNDITITATTGGSTQASILAGEGQTQKTQYIIPMGYGGYLTHGFVSTDAGSHVNAQLLVKQFGESWRVKHDVTLTSGYAEFSLVGQSALPEKSLLKWRALGTNPNNEVQAGYTMILVENP